MESLCSLTRRRCADCDIWRCSPILPDADAVVRSCSVHSVGTCAQRRPTTTSIRRLRARCGGPARRGSARPLDATGTVAPPRDESGKEDGFWVVFNELSDDARAFLDVVLRSRGVAGPGRPPRKEQTVRAGDRRACFRMPALLQVSWKSAREFLEAYSANISRGGIFIATDNPPPMREIVELSLALPDGLPPVKTRAEVVHLVLPAEARLRGVRAGGGLQFLDSGDEFRARLDACVKALRE